MNDHKTRFAMQQIQEHKIRHVIDAATAGILNSFFQMASDNIERQAVIEVAQDLNHFELSQTLIERFELINNQ